MSDDRHQTTTPEDAEPDVIGIVSTRSTDGEEPARNWTYVRWRTGEPRIGPCMAPLAAGHPVAGADCPMCQQPLKEAERVRLFVVGADADDIEHLTDRTWFSARAVVIHGDCEDTAAARVRAEGGTDGEATPARGGESP